jgi:C-terminal processing protease CtpA/Prc
MMKKKIFNYLIYGCIVFILQVTPSFSYSLTKQVQPVSEKGIHNISVFNKVYGYVRHFSPTLAVDTFYGWEDLLLKYLPLVENAKNDIELCDIITMCFVQLEPNLVVKPFDKKNQSIKLASTECNSFYVHRYSKGWGNRNENATTMKFLYTSKIEKCSTDFNLYKTTYENIFIALPLTTCVNDSIYKHYNTSRDFDPRTKLGQYSISNKYVRIGIIMEVWNVQEYFYPYLKEMKIDNEAIFKKYLDIVSKEMDEANFFETLEYYGAEYKDGHAAFMPFASMSKWPDYVPPIKIQLIENELIITYVSDSLKNLIAVGDKIISIDNVFALDYYKKKQQKISSATQTWNKYLTEKELLLGYKNTTISFEILKNGVVKTLLLHRTTRSGVNEDNATKRSDIYNIKKDYYYVNLFNLRDSALKFVSENFLTNAKGIVFDCRGYPRGNVAKIILSHLTNDTLHPTLWTIPVQTSPSQNEVRKDTVITSSWIIPPMMPKFTDNIVFIVDGRNISAAETILAMVEQYKLGKIVGEQTAGTNGNINSFILFGLYQFWHTQMYVPRYDGSQHHGVGIIPEVQIKSATLQDVLNGKDQFVIKAIEMSR